LNHLNTKLPLQSQLNNLKKLKSELRSLENCQDISSENYTCSSNEKLLLTTKKDKLIEEFIENIIKYYKCKSGHDKLYLGFKEGLSKLIFQLLPGFKNRKSNEIKNFRLELTRYLNN
jgi:hypothetical protein